MEQMNELVEDAIAKSDDPEWKQKYNDFADQLLAEEETIK